MYRLATHVLTRVLYYSDEDLEHIKSFLHKFKVTRPARQQQADSDDEDNMEDEDDDLAINDTEGSLKYQEQLVSTPSASPFFDAPDLLPALLQQRVANREQERLVIDLEDLNQVRCRSLPPSNDAPEANAALPPLQDATNGRPLVQQIQRNAQRYIKLFSKAVDEELPEPTVDITAKSDILDVIQYQRNEKNAENEEAGEAMFPPNLLRR